MASERTLDDLKKYYDQQKRNAEMAKIANPRRPQDAQSKTAPEIYGTSDLGYLSDVARHVGEQGRRLDTAYKDYGIPGVAAQTAKEVGKGWQGITKGIYDMDVAATNKLAPVVLGEKGTQATRAVLGDPTVTKPTRTKEQGITVTNIPEGSIEREYPAPLTGSTAVTLPGGKIFSTMPGWSDADQAQLEQLRSEGYGMGRVAREKERARIASLRPTKTSKRERQKMIRDARRRGTKMTHSRRGWGEDTSAADAEIANLNKQFAQEDAAQRAFNVAQLKDQPTETGPSLQDQIDIANLQLDVGKADFNQQMRQMEMKQQLNKDRQAEIEPATRLYGLPVGSEGLLMSLSSQLGTSPMKLGPILQSQMANLNEDQLALLSSQDPDDAAARAKVLQAIQNAVMSEHGRG